MRKEATHMKCPFCNSNNLRVVDSRPTEESNAIRRRRECEECSKRFTTYEKIEMVPLMVIKKDGRREPFDSQKIYRGLVKACEKRPVALKALEELVRDVETAVYNSLEQEIQSEKIGEMVIERLRDLDEVSYVRFASVYRQFRDINMLLDEIKGLVEDGPR